MIYLSTNMDGGGLQLAVEVDTEAVDDDFDAGGGGLRLGGEIFSAKAVILSNISMIFFLNIYFLIRI